MSLDREPQTGHKRKRGAALGSAAGSSSMAELPSPAKKVKTPRTKREPAEEKRLRRFRPHPPQSFHGVYQRATSQRFFVLSRARSGFGGGEKETVELVGTTGNVYTVIIARQPTCDCPHAEAGNQCKHVLYVMKRVLRAKFEYIYQLALLGREVQDIFNTAGPIPSENGDGQGKGNKEDKNRKPVEGDCPICYEELLAGGAVVWCRASCGQNIHKTCIEKWASTKRQQGQSKVTCPYCRSNWEGDTDMMTKIENKGAIGAEGYRNVAAQLGINTERDTSTYSSWWTGRGGGRRNGYGRYSGW